MNPSTIIGSILTNYAGEFFTELSAVGEKREISEKERTEVFAVNDQTTARYMSERLGEHIVWRKQRTFNQETQKYEEEWMPQGPPSCAPALSLAARSAGIAAIR
jgi:hypothetical protein